MKIFDKNLRKLLLKYREIYLLEKTTLVLNWDLNVNLPSKATDARAEQISYLSELITEKWLDPEFKANFEKVVLKKEKLSELERGIVRNLERESKLYYKVPKEIITKKARLSTLAFMSWRQARLKNRFSFFLPNLVKLVELDRVIAEHLGYSLNPYDALLDLYEPGLTSGFLKKIFERLKEELTPIIIKITSKDKTREKFKIIDSKKIYPLKAQKKLSFFVLKKMGYDFASGRMDVSPHPFTTTLGRFDVRITNRYKKHDFRESLMGAMHEGGHALYNQGINKEYEYTPLDGGASLGIHESQSRFWENQIGRSEDFLRFMTPILQAFFPNQLSGVDNRDLFVLFNKVEPGFIRVEADEVTYNLHIALRFEIEDALINATLKPKGLPEVWRVKMKNYLGIVPENDNQGVLQDVHWSYGAFGYFPTYTLGNLYAALFYEVIRKELEVEDLVSRGEFTAILSWLRENIHKYGKFYWPDELVERVTGKSLDSNHFIDYIKTKYSKIYELSL